MKLEKMSMAMLLDLHNSIAEKPAGPKTFATRNKMIDRIQQIAIDRNINLDAFKQGQLDEAAKADTRPSTTTIESADVTPEKKKERGNGVGELARRLLLDPDGFPLATIAEMVNAAIPGSTTTSKSVSWYGSKMRKEGIDVPERRMIRNDHIWITDPTVAAEWLKGVRVVGYSSASSSKSDAHT